MSDIQKYNLKVNQAIEVRITGENLVVEGDGGLESIEALYEQAFQQAALSIIEQMRSLEPSVAIVVTRANTDALLCEAAQA